LAITSSASGHGGGGFHGPERRTRSIKAGGPNDSVIRRISHNLAKRKRPFELIVSSMRGKHGFHFTMNDNASNWFMYAFARTGQAPFQWSTPDGYPDTKAPWLGNNSLIMCWNRPRDCAI
jgi:hypothetical protein